MRLRLCIALAFFLGFSVIAHPVHAAVRRAIGGPPPDLARLLPPARPLRLAEQLFAESNYLPAVIETRLATEGITNAYVLAKAELIRALANLRRDSLLPDPAQQAVATLETLWAPDSVPDPDAEAPEFIELRAVAAYELGRYRMSLRQGAPDALPPLAHAFLHTRNTTLFQLSACSLHFLFSENADLAKANPDLASQVAFSLSAWSSSVWKHADPRAFRPRAASSRRSLATLPARAFIAFYRTQIRPAIGSRCALVPSCSEYFLQATKKHGILGIPFIGDRFIRESRVTQDAKVLVERADGSIRIADPVSDHDYWFTKQP